MSELPAVIAQLLSQLGAHERSPAYLSVDREGRLQRCGGALEAYGLSDLSIGAVMQQEAYFLFGVVPVSPAELDVVTIDLPMVEIENGVTVDLHVRRERDCDWILVLDATAQQKESRRLQQEINEASLRAARKSKSPGT